MLERTKLERTLAIAKHWKGETPPMGETTQPTFDEMVGELQAPHPSRRRRRPMEEARKLCLVGWNHACGRCGSFGALWWVPDLRPNGDKLRLCNDCVNDRSRARRALADIERVRFNADGSERDRA